jgi:hypothetical protein
MSRGNEKEDFCRPSPSPSQAVHGYTRSEQQSQTNAQHVGKQLRDKAVDSSEGVALKKGTCGHIQSAACMATRESVTAAHNKCLNQLITAVIKHRKKRSGFSSVKDDKDVSFKTAWETSALRQVCTVEQVEQAAKEAHFELKSNQELGRNQEEVDMEKFWRQRPDQMAVNHYKRTIYIIEFTVREPWTFDQASKRAQRPGRIANTNGWPKS